MSGFGRKGGDGQKISSLSGELSSPAPVGGKKEFQV
jgi:hypothetical protein